MENFPPLDPKKAGESGVDIPDKDKFLRDLEGLLKSRQSSELIGTFKAGAIPVILDTLSRDTSKKGREIVDKLYKIIEDLDGYYKERDAPKVLPAEGTDKVPTKVSDKPQEGSTPSKS